MLHVLCALKPEARPLVEYFELRPVPKTGPFRICQNLEAGITLTLSGVGQSAAERALGFTHDYFAADKSHAWLNLGTAGHAALPTGRAVTLNRVTDAATGQTWFPSRVFPTALPAFELLTLEAPCREYRAELFDMEGAGFLRAATRLATLELVHIIKVVSDNAARPMEAINGAQVSGLIRENLALIEQDVQQLQRLSREERRLTAPGEEFETVASRWRFTTCQRHRLVALTRKWRVLHPGATSLAKTLAGCTSARQVLECLQRALDNAPITLHNSPRCPPARRSQGHQ